MAESPGRSTWNMWPSLSMPEVESSRHTSEPSNVDCQTYIPCPRCNEERKPRDLYKPDCSTNTYIQAAARQVNLQVKVLQHQASWSWYLKTIRLSPSSPRVSFCRAAITVLAAASALPTLLHHITSPQLHEVPSFRPCLPRHVGSCRSIYSSHILACADG